jgi:hypothetical protein
MHSSCTMSPKKHKIAHSQKTLSGFVGVPEPVVVQKADEPRSRNALTFNDNWLKDPQHNWLYRNQEGYLMFFSNAPRAKQLPAGSAGRALAARAAGCAGPRASLASVLATDVFQPFQWQPETFSGFTEISG